MLAEQSSFDAEAFLTGINGPPGQLFKNTIRPWPLFIADYEDS
jgi:hypothetical protein